ncbi:unnamed protein product [Polarella glacialis]|uniref:Uncharacterized protein n=1 Tax=Polarella glacialis TaxID=89957 RepID=A0A813FG63_POLGL|nr:unnamed protein product [Polarella glacialis]
MPSPKSDGRTRLAKLKPKTGKMANSSSGGELATGDIDWTVFGLDLEAAPGVPGLQLRLLLFLLLLVVVVICCCLYYFYFYFEP